MNTVSTPAPTLGGARAYVVWIAAILAYSVAVMQRTTMGVAGLEATERFNASATIVSTFVVLQLAVYAALQVPVAGSQAATLETRTSPARKKPPPT